MKIDLSNENVIHIKKNGVEYLQFRRLLDYKNTINHAYGIGTDKDYRTARANQQELEPKVYEKAIEDYRHLCQAMDSKLEYVIKTNQEHTNVVKIVKEKIKINEPDINLEQYIKTDGLVTNQKKQLLATTNADCILLLFFDPVKKVIANIHSGWRGTLQRISIKTVEKMQEAFACNPEDILCCICPSIRKCHFEVEKEVKDSFEEGFKDIEEMKEIIEEKIPNKKWNIDTVRINQILLEKQGLKAENIIDSKICSVCHCDQIHSYRAERQGYGLNTALIELK